MDIVSNFRNPRLALVRLDRCLDNIANVGRHYLNIAPPHPAIRQLSVALTRAKTNRLIDRIRSPRRLALTISAILLGVIWLGQAIAGIVLRQPATTADLMDWIPVSLFVYCAWNFLKIAGQKPIEPFEWTDTEKELLLGAPLQKRDVIRFRCETISRAALVKSLIFSFVMLPDLSILPLGFLGILSALVFIELVRVITEIFAYGMNATERLIFQVATFGVCSVIVLRAVIVTIIGFQATHALDPSTPFGLMFQFLGELKLQTDTWYGSLLLSPFRWFTDIIIASEITGVVLAKLCLTGTVLWLISLTVPCLDKYHAIRRLTREKNTAESGRGSDRTSENKTFVSRTRTPARFHGAGSLAWRQWLGARSFRFSLIVSLLIPAVLVCMPAISGVTGFPLVANTVGALAFYSMILLPASLKFDFRRDIDRLNVLKSLPLSPAWIAAGQLAVPVLLTTIFQLFSLLLVLIISPYNPLMILGGLAVLLPFSLLIFSFENLAFLWYPHRINQEGMQVLIRSILVFTAKSLLFAVAFAITFLWVLISGNLAEGIFGHIAWLNTPRIFAAGMFAMLAMAAAITFTLLVRAFSRFDPSADLVGLD